MPTIDDVARRAGVSRSTVSLVINKSPRVKDSTREWVERVIEEMQYFPNSNARGLSAKVTNNLGVIYMQDFLPSTTEISYDNDQHVGLCSANINNGIMAGLTESDYGIVSERFCSISAPNELPRLIREKRVDGAFVVGLPYSDQFIENMKKTGIPFVIVGVGSWEDTVDSIYASPSEGTVIAMKKLVETGHKKICLLNSSTELKSHSGRKEVYRQFLLSHGLPYDEDWHLVCEKNTGKEGYRAFKAFWEAGHRPDAVVTANGQTATGVLNYLYEQGISVPEEISIIAYEDSSLCGYAVPPLTSINIRKEELGKKAAQCLLARIQNTHKEIEHCALPPYMVERDSVKSR